MKVILYMAMSANGYIAQTDGETPWSEAEWEGFSEAVGRAENIIVGRKTYEIMKSVNEIEKIGNPFVIVVSSEYQNTDSAVFVKSPLDAMRVLEERGVDEVLVAGGGMLNAAFMSMGLIDEIYLDVEPIVFGTGVKLFADSNFTQLLELLAVRQLSKNTVQLHYKVI